VTYIEIMAVRWAESEYIVSGP